MTQFWSDYLYKYLYQNETILQLANQELFKFLTATFDGKAQSLITVTSDAKSDEVDNKNVKDEDPLVYLKKRKYWYQSVTEE